MGQAYTPGLQLSRKTPIRRIRELPIPGRALVAVGDKVVSTTQVLATELPGDLDIIRIAERMGFDPEDVAKGLKVKVGDNLKPGDLLCEVKTFFNLFTTDLKAQRGGVIEFFTEVNGHLGVRQPAVPLTVEAYISGKIVEVDEGKSVTIEAIGTLAQGIFGVGGERRGRITILPTPSDTKVTASVLEKLDLNYHDAVLVGGSSFTRDALEFISTKNVAGVVTGSIDAETLRDYVGHDIGVSITGDEEVPATLIVTEGFGELPMSDRFLSLMSEQDGMESSINGATQVRAGAMRPEVIVPVQTDDSASFSENHGSHSLEIGCKVRIIRVPYFGQIGQVTELPSHPEQVESGATVRVLRVELPGLEIVTVPRANVEIVQD